jgi:hypothetical protein
MISIFHDMYTPAFLHMVRHFEDKPVNKVLKFEIYVYEGSSLSPIWLQIKFFLQLLVYTNATKFQRNLSANDI